MRKQNDLNKINIEIAQIFELSNSGRLGTFHVSAMHRANQLLMSSWNNLPRRSCQTARSGKEGNARRFHSRIRSSPNRQQHRHRRQEHNRQGSSSRHFGTAIFPAICLLPTLALALPLSFRDAFNASSWFGSGTNPDLQTFRYTTHRIAKLEKIGVQHVLLRIELSEGSRRMFDVDSAPSSQGQAQSGDTAKRYVTIQHVCVKSPDLQIERPYTPINDPAEDGYIDIIVKRVPGGEVGR